jgi:hypothetical protein
MKLKVRLRPGVKRRLRPAVRVFRSLAGEDSAVEHFIKGRLSGYFERIRGDGFVHWNGARMSVVQSTADPSRRTGIFLKGACDLSSLLMMSPLFRGNVDGTVAIVRSAGIAANRADVLLQTLDELPRSVTKDVRTQLQLNPDYFEPTLFEPEFVVPGLKHLGSFPKTVVVLSLAPNVVRTLYRHREHGFLVDPGGWWLDQSLDGVLRQPERVAWFKENFTSVGRLSIDEFVKLFRALVRTVRERTGAQLLVTNVLTVEPGDRAHNYQLRKNPEGLRRREFSLALVDLSRELGFHVLDVDRLLKRHGVDRQVDFAHFPGDLTPAIAAEGFRLLKELEVL